MTTPRRSPWLAVLERFLPRLKHPHLFTLLLALFALDLFLPDPVPFIDEAVLGLLTLLVGSWRSRRQDDEERPPIKDVTPPDQ
jgi:hypothetical protein